MAAANLVIEDVQVRLDDSKLTPAAARIAERGARNAARATVDRIQANITRLGRIDTGEMLNSWTIRSDVSGLHPRMFISSGVPYMLYQERGTRAHGPRTAKFMVFTPKGSNRVVFAKWVRGVKAGHFVRDAYRRLSVSDFVR